MQDRRKKWGTIEPPLYFFGEGGMISPIPPDFVKNRSRSFSFKKPWITISIPPKIFGPSCGPALHLVVRSFSYYTVL